MIDAIESYVSTVLRSLPDEAIVSATGDDGPALANPYDPSQGFADDDQEKPYDPWEDGDEAPEAGPEASSGLLDIAALRRKAAARKVGEAG